MFEYLGEDFVISEDQFDCLCEWIRNSFVHKSTINSKYHDGMLKHWFHCSPKGFYVHNDVFLKAMEKCGFQSLKNPVGHVYFNISEASSAVAQYYLKC